MTLCFVDTETTGFDNHESLLIELTYAIEREEPKTLYFGVTTAEVPDFINNLIKFDSRGIDGMKSVSEDIQEFLDRAKDTTMVAANPAFDKYFLKRYELFPFHYRMVDIESYAMAKWNLDTPPGMNAIFKRLVADGFALTEPDHSSYNDVRALQQAYYILKEEY